MADRFHVIDSHTGGEPTRLIVDAPIDLGDGPLSEQRARFASEFDRYRSALCGEPRGSDVMVGGLLVEPHEPDCAAGVIFFNNVGMLGMCGHGTIGLVETLRHLGRLTPGEHRIDTPAGVVRATLHPDRRVSVRNVVSRRVTKGLRVSVPAIGEVVGDLAWGGNWFYITDVELDLTADNVDVLTAHAAAIMAALADAGHTGTDGGRIDHVELVGPPTDDRSDARNFVLCPGSAWDRSPCGTGCSAKLACLAADGKLKPGAVFRQMSPIGSVFEGSYEPADDGVVPTITGRAFVNGEVTVIADPDDPFAWGLA